MMDSTPDFRVPLNYVAPYLDGVYLAVNAIPDAYLVYHAHDCGYFKAEKITANHDLFSDLLRWDQMKRIVRTNIGTQEFVMGGGDKLSRRLRQVNERYRPRVVFVAASNVVIMAGEDLSPHVRALESRVDAPLILLPARNAYLDYLTGYLDTVAGYLSRIEFTGEAQEPGEVALAGYVFDRHEGDRIGDLNELRRLLTLLGVKPGTAFLDGSGFEQHSACAPPTAVLDLAHAWKGGRVLAERTGARYLEVGLPIGIEGTCDWLRRAGEFLGVSELADELIERELAELVPMLQWLMPRYLMGKGVMLFADRLWLPGLARFVEEMGGEVLGVGVTSFGFDKPDATGAFSLAHYPALPVHTEELTELVRQLRGDGRLDLIIGNSLFHQNLASLGVPFVEMGYPSNGWHVLYPQPSLGFQGVRVLVERIINETKRSGMAASPNTGRQ